MRCIEISQPGGPEVLREIERPAPTPQANEVLIQVRAAGVNRPDVLQRRGNYQPPADASDLPGLEVAGTVIAVGKEVTWPAVGEQVCALTPGGGYAEHCTTPAVQCLPIPAGLDMVTAAAIPETYFTVWFNLFMRTDVRKANSILIHGGSSGIGTTAIQLGKHFGLQVIVTAGNDEKLTACTKLGADTAINYTTADFVAVTKEVTNNQGVDVVLDMVGGDYISRNLAVLAHGGTLVQIAFLTGSKVELDLMRVMRNCLTITGSTMRPQPVTVKAEIAEQLQQQVLPLLAAGKCRPVIHATYPLAEAATAHAEMEASQHIGKIMLTI